MEGLALGGMVGMIAYPATPNLVQVPNSTGRLVTFQTRASRRLSQASLTPDLRDLIFQCMSRFTRDRPSLQDAQRICLDAVTNKSAIAFAELGEDALFETDRAVQEFIQNFVLDAEVEEATRRLEDGRRHSMPNETARIMAEEQMRMAVSEGY